MTGTDLKLHRLSAGVTAASVAEQLGLNPSTICRLEGREGVRMGTALKYLEGLSAAVGSQEEQRRRAALELVRRGLAVIAEPASSGAA